MEPKSQYSYDPFASGTQSRWGRRGADAAPLPEIEGYEILDKIGSGGMGSVWSARYLPLNQIRAVKVLDKALAEHPTFIELFSMEAKALGRLEHPNIVKVYDANAEHNPPYMAMQWVQGTTLSSILGSRKVSLDEAIGYFEQIALALDYAHSRGFVHRDIKPSNVMVTETGQALLIDFGVANFLGSDGSSKGTITGTTRYLSPEVCQGRPATSASDIWAFAVMIYRTLTGHLPFDDPSGEMVLLKITADPPESPAGVSPKLRTFLLNSLNKDPKQRYKSATSLVADLKKAAHPMAVKVKGEGAVVTAAMGMFIAVGVLVIVLLGGVAYNTLQRPAPKAKTFQTAAATTTAKPAETAPPTPALMTNEPVAAVVASIKGAWFADLGTRWAEVMIEPTGGRAFRASFNVRDEKGLTTVAVSGEVLEDDQTVNYNEDEAKLPDGQGTFTGLLSEDRGRIFGTRTVDGKAGESIRFVRAADVVMTPYENGTDGYTLAIPAGWKASETVVGSARVTTFSPVGKPVVAFRVIVSPAPTAGTMTELFEDRERELSGRPDKGVTYQRMNMNPSANLAGRGAVSWEFRRQEPPAELMRGLFHGVLRGDRSTTTEAWSPVAEDEVWVPLFERIRNRFRLTD